MVEPDVVLHRCECDVVKSTQKVGERALALAIILAAFGLRVFRLGTQSLWGDEMFSVYRAHQTLSEITAAVPSERTLPPLYYYLLHFWIRLVGTTEFAVRFPSVVFGLLAVALLFVLVRRTLGRRVATMAALLAALSPFWIYYAQETRTYAQVTALLVLALYLLVRAAGEPDSRTARQFWAGYVIAATLALYSFYLAAFGLAAGVSWVLIQRSNWPRIARRCLIAQLVALLLLAPLAILAGPGLVALAAETKPAGPSPGTILQHLDVAFSYGTTTEPARAPFLMILAIVLVGLGLIASPWRPGLFWWLVLAIPVVGTAAVSFVPQAGWERYFLPATPAWFALIAAGLNAVGSAIPRRFGAVVGVTRGLRARPPNRLAAARWGLAAVAGGAVVYSMALSLHNYYFDPAYWRSDFRDAVHRVDGVATPDVAAVVNGPPQSPSFFYYFRGTIPASELPRPNEDASQTRAHLAVLAARYGGLWLIKYHPADYDVGGTVESWLGQNTYHAGTTWVENTTFSLYLTDHPETGQVVAESAVTRTFGEDAQLVGYRATTGRCQNKDYLLVTLTWRALRRSEEGRSVFAHLLDRNGQILAQSDHEPVVNLRPARTWVAGDLLEDRFALRLPDPSARTGLSLAVGMYRPDGTRLPIVGLATPDNSLVFALTGLQ